MSIILGINAFHADSSACLVVDGKLVAAIAEERLGDRLKHDPRYPFHAIAKVLEVGNVRLKEVTHICIARNVQANKIDKMRYLLTHPRTSLPLVGHFLDRKKQTEDMWSTLAAYFGEDIRQMKWQIVEVEHHLAHIASAYYLSPFESLTAGFSYDGSGDFASMMAAKCEGTEIDILDRVTLPQSLGFFYSAVCQFIGFDHFGEEYKVMGLAPYGHDNYRKEMEQLISLKGKTWFGFNSAYLKMPEGYNAAELDDRGHITMPLMYSDKMKQLLGTPRKRENPLTQREMDIARSCQVRFEEAALHCMNRLHALVPSQQFAMAGGSALNGVANARILRETAFTTPYLQAAASDEGTCLGAAYWCYHNVVKGKERFHMHHAFWGGEYTEGRIKQAIEALHLQAELIRDEDVLLDKVVNLISEGHVVGWFQGRSEWGPRALGNRSILADPTNPRMKDIINAKIKRRESFRPFAPSVLAEKVRDYFEQDVFSPFMMHVVKFKKEWRDRLPAVVHVDGTGRLQSVAYEENPRYYNLIKRFGEKSGVFILLNTSFNENEPVVETPEEALSCFMRTDMDAICLENYLVKKIHD